MKYDYEWIEGEDYEYCYEIFEIAGGKVVAHADSEEEALEIIEEMEYTK